MKALAPLVAAAAIAAAPLAAIAAQPMSMSMSSMHGIPPGGDGPAYTGAPALETTASLLRAGGGPAMYTTAKALTAMVGEKTVDAELAKLTKQYGKAKVASWIEVSDFAVRHSAKTAIDAGVKLPMAETGGHALAVALVKLGTTGGTFYTGTMLDHLVTHKIHAATMNAIDAKFGVAADGNYHRISNQAFVDVAHALGATSIKVAAFH